MEFDVNFKIKTEEVKESIVEEIKNYEDEVLTVEGTQELIKLHFFKSLIEKYEVKDDLLKEAENKNTVLKRRNDEFSKLIKKQSDENKMLKVENEKLCNCLNELQNKLDNMEQHTAILDEEKEEIKQLLKLKTMEVGKLKTEIDVLKSEMEDDTLDA